MKSRNLVSALVLAAVIAGAAWFSWRWYTTPVPPEIPLDGVDKQLADMVEQTVQEVRRQPRSAEAWGKLGLLLAVNGFEEPAVPCFFHAERFEPDSPRWPYLRATLLLTRNGPEGIRALRHALGLAQASEVRAAILFQLALALVERGEIEEAQDHLQALRQIEGDSPRVHFGLGLAANAQHKPGAAHEHLAMLLDDPHARKQASALLATLADGDTERAPIYKQQAARLPPDLPWPSPFAADMQAYDFNRTRRIAHFWDLDQQGRHEEGLDFLRKLVAESPDAEACFVLGITLFKMNQFDEAEQVFRSVLRFDAKNVKTHVALATTLLHRGELSQQGGVIGASQTLYQEVVALGDQTLKLQSNLGQAHLLRALALKHLGRTEESVAAFRQALLCQPESAEIHLGLGEMLAAAGQLPEALVHLRNAVRVAPADDPRPRAALDAWLSKAKKLEPGP